MLHPSSVWAALSTCRFEVVVAEAHTWSLDILVVEVADSDWEWIVGNPEVIQLAAQRPNRKLDYYPAPLLINSLLFNSICPLFKGLPKSAEFA